MAGKLCLLCCQNFRPEVEAAVAAEGWPDVAVAAFPARCGRPPVDWNEMRPLLAPDCTRVLIFGRSCLQGLGAPPADWPPTRLHLLDECFQLVAGPTLVAEAIGRDAYIVTPAWLADWQGQLRQMGFEAEAAAPFFRDFAKELVLLDTGVLPGAPARLAELAAAVGLPASRVAVGVDYTRLLLARLVADWRREEGERQERQEEEEHGRERADHLAAMDFLGRVAVLKDEPETIAAIEDLFRMLFAPEIIQYVRFVAGTLPEAEALPDDLARQARSLDRDWAWTESGTGFLLRIARGGETLGVVVADRFAFPQFRSRYLNLALSVAGVCGLAIENARTYRRIREAEEALKRSEHSLKMAQAVAHVGHWEWDVDSGDMRWSDETFRILGYEPQALTPSRDLFFQVIHPDDRAKVAAHIAQARKDGAFDLEYRIILADSRVRVVHGLGEVVATAADRPPRMIGTIREMAAPGANELLGVIQDITDRKQLEWRLVQEAHTDALTGCANRRHFLEVARQELARIRRYGGELSVFMLDLDHFKAVNDRYGHHVGDLVLQRFVQVCRATLREEDVVGRLGGEEFAVLLPQTGQEEALEVAERLRRAVATTEVPLEGQAPVRFTTSVGVATVAPDDAGMDQVLGRADQAVYAAKKAGRNQVATAEMAAASRRNDG